MTLQLFYHPFSSYSWKVLVPIYEADTAVEFRIVGEEQATRDWLEAWPIARFPVFVDTARGRTVPEASIIIEYLDAHHPGPAPMLPADPDHRLEVRTLDRVFDNYVHAPMQRIVADFLRPPEDRDRTGVGEARAMLDSAYAWLERHMAGRDWAAGDAFTLADCAAAPALFYADWVHPMAGRFPEAAVYRARLNARPSMVQVVDDARPYRGIFPPGAPDRD